MINLRSKDRLAIEKIASDIFPPQTELWAYGSRVKGNCSDSSDLDLLIIFPQSSDNDLAQLDKLNHFKTSLTESTIPIFVDVFTWKYIPDNFKQDILKTRELLLKI